MNGMDRFAQRLRLATRDVTVMATEAFTGLDAMAASDEYIHSSDESSQHLRKKQQRQQRQQQPSTTKRNDASAAAVPLSASLHYHHERDAVPWHRSPSLPVGVGESSSSSSSSEYEPSREGFPLSSVSSSAATLLPPRNPLLDPTSSALELAPYASPAARSNGAVHEIEPTTTFHSSTANIPPAARFDVDNHDDEADALDPPAGERRPKKDSRRFFLELEDRIQRPINSEEDENEDDESSHLGLFFASPSRSVPLEKEGGRNRSWSRWLAAAAATTTARASTFVSNASAPPPHPPPLLARVRPDQSSSNCRNPTDSGGDEDREYEIRSSSAMLGDEERAQLAALMGTTTTASKDGLDFAATATTTAIPSRGPQRFLTILARKRRETCVGVTLVAGLLVYCWARDRTSSLEED
jgi:hypothetical protein